jgi:hypothetical protein
MGRRKSKPQSRVSASRQSVAPQLIYEATLGANGAVIRVQAPISQAQAITIRRNDGNVVVCGPDKTANSILARDIEQAATGRWKRCRPHINAGPNALPHYQPDPRGETSGIHFCETYTKHPL